MKVNNNTIHRFIVPLGYTFSWLFGIFIGGGFFDWFGLKDISIQSKPTILLFYSSLTVYAAFLLECIFIFIDWGAIYKEEAFSGKLFNVVAGIFAHFFITLGLVGWLYSKMDTAWVYILTAWVVLFKFGISLMEANIHIWMVVIKVRTLTSHTIEQ